MTQEKNVLLMIKGHPSVLGRVSMRLVVHIAYLKLDFAPLPENRNHPCLLGSFKGS